MARSKDKDGVEFWRGKYRELLKENRQLRKQLRQAEKHYVGQDEPEEAMDSEDTQPRVYKRTCESCGKGELKTFEIIGRMFEECSVCDHRRKV